MKQRAIAAGCDECRHLNDHAFRSSDDLVHAFQVAAAETDRGILRRLGDEESLTAAEQRALASAISAGALPDALRYRFQCALCGDRFELVGDVERGTGGWVRAVKEGA